MVKVREDYTENAIGKDGAEQWLANIDQIEETTIKWIQWSGQGWRLKSLKHIGYITGNGSGIHLALSTGREYTL